MCAYDSFCTSKFLKKNRGCYVCEKTDWLRVGLAVLVGLLRHDEEVEGVVVKDDAVLELCVRGRACYAQAHIPKRRSHHCVPSACTLAPAAAT